jgi:hypothetical protein
MLRRLLDRIFVSDPRERRMRQIDRHARSAYERDLRRVVRTDWRGTNSSGYAENVTAADGKDFSDYAPSEIREEYRRWLSAKS